MYIGCRGPQTLGIGILQYPGVVLQSIQYRMKACLIVWWEPVSLNGKEQLADGREKNPIDHCPKAGKEVKVQLVTERLLCLDIGCNTVFLCHVTLELFIGP
jgi:hypothetical protein